MGWIGAAVAVAGMVSNMVSSAMGSQQQAAELDQQADTLLSEADREEAQEVQTYAAGLQNELSTRRANSRQMGSVRAAVGESGFDAASGTALAVQSQAAQDFELEALSQRYASLIKGYGHADQARANRSQATALLESARQTRRSSEMSLAIWAPTEAFWTYQTRKALK